MLLYKILKFMLIGGMSKMWQYCKELFVPFFVHALRAMAYGGVPFSIDMNALWAITYWWFIFY